MSKQALNVCAIAIKAPVAWARFSNNSSNVLLLYYIDCMAMAIVLI